MQCFSAGGRVVFWRRTGALLVLLLALSGGATAAAAAAPVSSPTPVARTAKLHKGDWVVMFSGHGSGTFEYGWPSWSDSNGNCVDPSESYTLSYSYDWSWTDVVGRLGAGTIADKWTGGGNTSSDTTNGNECGGPVVPSGSCTGTYRAPTGNDSGLWPELTVDKSGRRNVLVKYADGGLPLVDPNFSPNCGRAEPDEYDGNASGFVETGTITAKVLFPLTKAERGKALSKPITASSANSCSSASACAPNLQQGDDQGPLTSGTACQPIQKWAGSPPEGGVVTCSSHDSYSGKLTVRYVK